MGKIDLDKSFEERTAINQAIVIELDKASEPWGVKVLRYEIKNINPPRDVLAAMEKQMRAEREKRAVILASEGERDAQINGAEGAKRSAVLASEGQAQAGINHAEGNKRAIVLASEGEAEARINAAEGDKQGRIKTSEAARQQRINDAEGRAKAMGLMADATAESITRVAKATLSSGGQAAIQLRLAEGYIRQFGRLAQRTNTLIVPADAANAVAMVRMAIAAGKTPSGEQKDGV